MIENTWASPAGYEAEPPRVRYRIRSRLTNGTPGAVVERRTQAAYDHTVQAHFHSLAPLDQHFGDKITELIQRACGYFSKDDNDYDPLPPTDWVGLTDFEVGDRIYRLDRGENAREALRTSMERYVLADLPHEQQRHLIEHIEILKHQWAFEILGEVQPDDPEPPVARPDPRGPTPEDYLAAYESDGWFG